MPIPPVVNIGRQQTKRQHAENVLFVPHNKKAILDAIKKALYDKQFKETVRNCTNPYGDGKAGVQIAEILAKVEINDQLIAKDITY